MNTVAAIAVAVAPLAGTAPADDEADTLAAMLLTVDDLPTGWATAVPDDDEPTGTDPASTEPADDCAAALDLEPDPDTTTTVEAGFEADWLDHLTHTVIRHHDADAAAETLDAYRTLPDECPTITENDSTWTVAEMSFPDHGDDTAALRLRLTDDTFPVAIVLVAIQVDDLTITLSGIGAGADADLLDDLAAIAVTRAST